MEENDVRPEGSMQPVPAHHLARTTDPETSLQAAIKAAKASAKAVEAVRQVMSDGIGRIDEEIWRACREAGYLSSSATVRHGRVALVRAGVLEDSGARRTTPDNANSVVWRQACARPASLPDPGVGTKRRKSARARFDRIVRETGDLPAGLLASAGPVEEEGLPWTPEREAEFAAHAESLRDCVRWNELITRKDVDEMATGVLDALAEIERLRGEVDRLRGVVSEGGEQASSGGEAPWTMARHAEARARKAAFDAAHKRFNDMVRQGASTAVPSPEMEEVTHEMQRAECRWDRCASETLPGALDKIERLLGEVDRLRGVAAEGASSCAMAEEAAEAAESELASFRDAIAISSLRAPCPRCEDGDRDPACGLCGGTGEIGPEEAISEVIRQGPVVMAARSYRRGSRVFLEALEANDVDLITVGAEINHEVTLGLDAAVDVYEASLVPVPGVVRAEAPLVEGLSFADLCTRAGVPGHTILASSKPMGAVPVGRWDEYSSSTSPPWLCRCGPASGSHPARARWCRICGCVRPPRNPDGDDGEVPGAVGTH